MSKYSLHINSLFVLLFGFIIAIGITKLGYGNKDVFLLFGILAMCVLFFLWSYQSIHKLTLRLLAIFLFLHLIVFPFVYLGLLKKNPKTFEFDTDIYNSEKNISLAEVYSKYSPENVEKKINILTSVLNSNYSILDTTISFLEAGNLLVVGAYIINVAHELYPPPPSDMQSINGPYLFITDGKGYLITSFDKTTVAEFRTGNKIGQILRQLKDYYISKKDNFASDAIRIKERNDIWTYKSILSYSSNIFFTSNMTPKSRIANVIFFIHYLVVVIFILGLLGGVFQSTILSKKNP